MKLHKPTIFAAIFASLMPVASNANEIYRAAGAGMVVMGMLQDQFTIDLSPSHDSKQIATYYEPPSGYKICYFTYGNDSANGGPQVIEHTKISPRGVAVYQSIGCALGTIPNDLIAPLVGAGATYLGLGPAGSIAATSLAYELGESGSCGSFGERSWLTVTHTFLLVRNNQSCLGNWPRDIPREPGYFHWQAAR